MRADMLEERWASFCRRIGVYGDESRAVYKTIIDAYSEPYRVYHNPQHILFCLEEFDNVRECFDYPAEAEMALWTHDIIYNIFSKQNEIESAKEGYMLSKRLGMDSLFCSRVYYYVLPTDHQSLPESKDARFIQDIDLAIFGRVEGEFWTYEDNIRKEFVDCGGLPETHFRYGRITAIRKFLDRPTIYSTEIFQRKYERRARINLKASLNQLR